MYQTSLVLPLLAAIASAQCQFTAIQVATIGGQCGSLPSLNAIFTPSTCSVDLHYLSWLPPWLPYGTWIALGDSPQLAPYPQLLSACPQLQNPIVIVRLTGMQMSIPIPAGLSPMTFYAGAVTLHREPNTGAWILAPARQTLQITLQ